MKSASQSIQENFQAITGGKLVEAFGMTEASPATGFINVAKLFG